MTTSGDTALITLASHDLKHDLAADVRRGMDRSPKTIPSKYFYDARGGALFGQITTLPEYYLTRAETAIIEAQADAILARAAACEILEIGSGSADKISLLLRHAPNHQVRRYASIDVNPAGLREAGQQLRAEHPQLDTTGYVGDFVSDLAHVPAADESRLIAFFGSTIGNLATDERAKFYADVAAILGSGDSFLLGLDLVKDREVLRRAYDDSAGITAEFTRNILRVVNRELGADFPADTFIHRPRWNEAEQRMEAWLEAPQAMTVTVADIEMTVQLAAGEEILTEMSCKFTRASVAEELAGAELEIDHWYSDAEATFALALIRPRAA